MMFALLNFAICTAIILFSGKSVAKYGDAIAEKTGLSGLWIGVILVSVSTSSPELFTGIGSTVFVNAPDLTIGNLFGANMYNLVNIAILDLIHKGGPLLSSVSAGQLFTAGLSLIPLTIAAVGIFLSQELPQIAFANISLYSVLILFSYLICTKKIFRFEQKQQQILKELHKEENILFKYHAISLRTAYVRYASSTLIIAGAGIWLAYIGDDLSRVLGLGQNFVGSLFLGFATTLPEITVSIAAVRLGAKELAVANMLGSNFFNMVIIFINDVFYRKAPIFEAISQQHIFTAFIVMLMTITVVAGLISKPKKKTKVGLSLSSIILITMFVVGAYINFVLRNK